MARPKKDPSEKASVSVNVRLTPHQAKCLDAVIANLGNPSTRPEFFVGMLKVEYGRQLKYGGLKPVKREVEQGG